MDLTKFAKLSNRYETLKKDKETLVEFLKNYRDYDYIPIRIGYNVDKHFKLRRDLLELGLNELNKQLDGVREDIKNIKEVESS